MRRSIGCERENDEWFFSFENVCDTVGLNASRLRHSLLEMVAGRYPVKRITLYSPAHASSIRRASSQRIDGAPVEVYRPAWLGHRHAPNSSEHIVTPFAPIRYLEGYLPIEDHGLIGDGTTAALIGRDGAIAWLCVPRFDSAPLFCRILDFKRGGAFTLAPKGLSESRQFYEPDTGVLVTEMRCPSGVVRLTDAC